MVDASMLEEGEEFYQIREDEEDAYRLEDFGDYTGNKKQNCLIQLNFPKIDFDYEWFGEYDVQFDARIYASETATEFIQVEPTVTTQDF